jgi:hypothetical protein
MLKKEVTQRLRAAVSTAVSVAVVAEEDVDVDADADADVVDAVADATTRRSGYPSLSWDVW